MRRKTFTHLLVAASVAAFIPLTATAAEPMQTSELAARLGSSKFEFRGRYNVWRFTPDGRVNSDYNTTRGCWGAMCEQWGLKETGTWRREGNKLCIKWERADECYTIAPGQGRMVTLMGPRTIEGTLEADGDTGYAETPAPAAPAQPLPPGYRYQRIPGPR